MRTVPIKWLVDKISKVTSLENDFNIVVTGFPGCGKSTLVLRTIEGLIGPGLFMPATMDKHNIFSRKEMDNFLEHEEHHQIRNVDEAINLFYKRDFHDKMQKKLIKKLNRYRYKRHVIFLTIPNFSDLDLSIRAMNLIKFWIHVQKPGVAWVYKQIENEFCADYWNITNNKKALMLKGKGRWQLKNTVACLTWKALPDKFHNVYKEVKKRKSADAEETLIEENKKISQRDVIWTVLQNCHKKGRKFNPTAFAIATGFLKSIIYNTKKDFESQIRADDQSLEAYT